MNVISLSIAGYTLRPWQPSDAPDMQRHLNNSNIGRNLADWYPMSGYTLAMAEDWCNGGSDAFGGSRGLNWAITYGDEAVGSCGVISMSGFERCNAEIGYWLSELHWGRGVGTAVVAELLHQAFAIPALTRVFAPIHSHNLASQRVCAKNGMVNEGLRRLSVMKAGRSIDTVVWAAYRERGLALA